MYNRGIAVEEKSTSYQRPLATKYGVQVIVGTAPINLAQDPKAAVNRPVMAGSYEEAVKALGYSEDWRSYSLCQSMYASFKQFRVYPVIFINVLDPERHRKEAEEKTYPVFNHTVKLEEMGILPDSIRLNDGTANIVGKAAVGSAQIGSPGEIPELKLDEDYIVTFDDAGRVQITFLSTGKGYDLKSVAVTCSCLAPELVTEEDIIGYRNIETGKDTGIELIRKIYTMFHCPPGLSLAPSWSKKPNVAAALQEKCRDENGGLRCECVIDLDTSKVKRYAECGIEKEKAGLTDPHTIVVWPELLVDGKNIAFSAVYGAMTSYYTATNGDIPYLYPSNKELQAEGAVLEDGTEVILDQTQAAYVNGDGVVTALNDSGWKSFGNNTGCYPKNQDPKDRWIGCRRMFSFVANYFMIEFSSMLDQGMNRLNIDDMVNRFNTWGNSLVSQGRCAGVKMEYVKEDNPDEDLLDGHVKVRIMVAPFTPMEYIAATEEFDMETLRKAIVGEAEA